MFIHTGAFNSIIINLSASASKNGKVRNGAAYKKLRIETCPWFNFYYWANGNFTKN